MNKRSTTKLGNRTPRRRFLLGAAAGISVVGSAIYFRSERLTPELEMLQSLVDTIVPRDDFPGAIDVGIDKLLNAEMLNKPKIKQQTDQLIESVMTRSLSQHKKSFYELNIDQRENLLSSMLESGAPQHDRRNLQRLQKYVLEQFYMSDQGHKSLGYLLPSHYPAYPAHSK